MPRWTWVIIAYGVLAASVGAVERSRHPGPAGAIQTEHPWRKPGDRVDSILPMPEYLRRFRAGTTSPGRFEGGAATGEQLARTFLAGVAARDTTAIAGMLVSRREFAWLLFPIHLYAMPPYEMDPGIFWLQLRAESDKGIGRVMRRYGGQQLRFIGLDCERDTLQIKTGPVSVWSPCRVRFQSGDSMYTRRLFGSLVQRDGRVKLLSLANEF